jgi:ppGpp synthetase/RelA/SpoT-type nucleotidyltranferase
MDEQFVQDWAKRYEAQLQKYKEFESRLSGLVRDLLTEHGIDVMHIESRTKSTDSFREKLMDKGHKYSDPLRDITDLVGIRVITHFLEDARIAGDTIRTNFAVDEENSWYARERNEPRSFGYRSDHYVVALNPQRASLPEWQSYRTTKAEVQVRTVVQHAWASIEHALIYKPGDPAPPVVQRRFARLSALLEIADEEFGALRTEVKRAETSYAESIERGELNIRVDAGSVDAYFRFSGTLEEWWTSLQSLGFRLGRRPSAAAKAARGPRIVKTLTLVGVTTLRELETVMAEAAAVRSPLMTSVDEVYAEHDKEVRMDVFSIVSLCILFVRGADGAQVLKAGFTDWVFEGMERLRSGVSSNRTRPSGRGTS